MTPSPGQLWHHRTSQSTATIVSVGEHYVRFHITGMAMVFSVPKPYFLSIYTHASTTS